MQSVSGGEKEEKVSLVRRQVGRLSFNIAGRDEAIGET
jgi:hypothetical protein